MIHKNQNPLSIHAAFAAYHRACLGVCEAEERGEPVDALVGVQVDAALELYRAPAATMSDVRRKLAIFRAEERDCMEEHCRRFLDQLEADLDAAVEAMSDRKAAA